MRTLYFRFVELDTTELDNYKKVDEEWEEWKAALGTPEEKKEHIDLIHALCNAYTGKWGYPSMKTEDAENIVDVSNRYKVKKENGGNVDE